MDGKILQVLLAQHGFHIYKEHSLPGTYIFLLYIVLVVLVILYIVYIVFIVCTGLVVSYIYSISSIGLFVHILYIVVVVLVILYIVVQV